jgi:hypothetical protein
MRTLVAVLGVSLGTAAQAAILCVNPGGTGGCFASIGAAANASGFGDEIEIAAGVYVGNVSFPDRKLIVRGAGPGLTVIQGVVDVPYLGRLDMSGFTLDGNGTNTGMVAGNESVVNLADCEITDFSIGIQCDEPYVVTFDRCAVHGNAGIGIFAYGESGDTPPRVTVRRSTVSGNGSRGIYFDSGSVLVRVEDSTISGNGSSGIESSGFGFPGRPKIRVQRSTIVGNLRGIVDATPPPARLRVLLDGSIVADSTGGPDVIGPAATVRSRGYNLIETLDPGTTLKGAGPNLLGVDPVLGPLQSNGGPTETHQPLFGSPAIDAVTKTARCRQPDQRGIARLPLPCDIGAYGTP